MRAWARQGMILVLGSLLALTGSHRAQASSGTHERPSHPKARTVPHAEATARRHESERRTAAEPHSNYKHSLAKNAKMRSYGARYAGISCVPFARSASGIELKGNAADWWYAASGVYERGARPEAGSVMDFRANGHMRLGHVAVVTRVVNSREVEIDHANWWGPGAAKGGVSRGIPVVDVSENNDWSEVRVGLGRSGSFGSVYATYGFIYDRPDHGTMIANNLPHSQLRVARREDAYDEVAEAVEPRRTDFRAPVHRNLQ